MDATTNTDTGEPDLDQIVRDIRHGLFASIQAAKGQMPIADPISAVLLLATLERQDRITHLLDKLVHLASIRASADKVMSEMTRHIDALAGVAAFDRGTDRDTMGAVMGLGTASADRAVTDSNRLGLKCARCGTGFMSLRALQNHDCVKAREFANSFGTAVHATPRSQEEQAARTRAMREHLATAERSDFGGEETGQTITAQQRAFARGPDRRIDHELSKYHEPDRRSGRERLSAAQSRGID